MCYVFDQVAQPERIDETAASNPAQALPWTATLLDGSKITHESIADKVTIIVYFATWCDPCKKEIPGLIELRNTFALSNVSIIGISMDQAGKDLEPFVNHYGINYQIARNSSSLDQSYGRVKYLPTILMVGKDGTIAHRHTGAVSKEVLEMQIKTLLM